MRTREIVALVAVLFAALSVGLITNPASFGENLLASICDLVLGIFIALYLINRVMNRERHGRWQRVRMLSYRSIASQCELIYFAFMGESGRALGSRRATSDCEDGPTEPLPLSRSFHLLAEEITARSQELATPNTIVFDPALAREYPHAASYAEGQGGVTRVSTRRGAEDLRREELQASSSQFLLANVSPHFENLAVGVFPRILELDEESELVSSFIEVESAYRDWSSNVATIEGDWGMPEKFGWDAAAQFCDGMSTMLRLIEASKFP